MKFFRIDKLPMEDKAYCILKSGPKGCDRINYKMACGEPAAAEFPPDARWSMTKAYPGIRVPAVIANTARLLVVHRAVKDVMAGSGVAMECLPFTLLDHKGRVASKDHFIINVLGTYDCLDLEKSEIVYSDTDPDEILDVEEYVADPRKLEGAPALFRIKEDPYETVISHRLLDELRPVDPTNLYFHELDQEA
jgi:hypothetical protein